MRSHADEDTIMKTLALALLATLALAGAVQAQSRPMDRSSATQGQAQYTAMPNSAAGPAATSLERSTSRSGTSASSPVISVWEHRLHSANQ